MTNKKLYTAFGLTISSEFNLPDLYTAGKSESDFHEGADVNIRVATIAGELKLRSGLTVIDGRAVLHIPEVATYVIQQGREIIVDPDEKGTDRNIRLYLLGSAFGAILYQRNILPLHANAIEIHGKAIAFSGHSGAGKSTLAAWFNDRGYRVISDDVCAITFDDGKPVVQGGLPRLRLWNDALQETGRTAENFERSFDDMEKYDVPTSLAPNPSPVQLAGVYVLHRAEPGCARAEIRRLTGIEAMDALVANAYRGAFAQELGTSRATYASCLSVLRCTPLFKAVRIWGFEHYGEEAKRMEAHALQLTYECEKLT